jgi:type I restriction enzyme S subunit
MGKYKRYERYKDSGVEWIGEVPVGWEIKSFRHCINLIKNGTSLTQVQEETKYKVTRIETISTGKIDYEKVGYVNYSKELERYKLQKGDILFSNINSFEMVGNVALYKSKESLYSGMNLLRIVPNKECCNTWLYYFIKSNYFNNKVKSVAKHAVNQVSVPTGKIKEINIVKPSLEEQNQIADFLDQKTSEIDALVADKEKLITLLEEKRQAMITEAVTKGLDPNVKMKDSGVEWIGEVPEHWEISKVKNYYDVCLGKMIQSSPRSKQDTLEKYLCSMNVKWDGIDITNIKEMWFSKKEKKKYELKSGDLVVCEGGDAGRAGIWEDQINNCYIQNAVHRVRGKCNNLNKYLYYWLYFVKTIGYIDLLCNRATIMHFTVEKLKDLILIIPDKTEQDAIVNYLDRNILQINVLTELINQQIQKLKEYRQSLISEAVTGKIDLRDKAGRFDD